MPNLGDRLRQIEAVQAQDQAHKDEAERVAVEATERARREAVQQFFTDAKRLIVEAIGAAKIPAPFVTPIEIKANGTFTIMSTDHPDHDLYEQFRTWVQSEGLVINGQTHEVGNRSAVKFYIKAA